MFVFNPSIYIWQDSHMYAVMIVVNQACYSGTVISHLTGEKQIAPMKPRQSGVLPSTSILLSFMKEVCHSSTRERKVLLPH